MLTSIARSARLLSTGAGLRRATHLHHSTGSSSSCCCCCCCYTTATLAWNRPSKDDSTATTTTTTSNTSTTITGGGIGLHNVRDQVLVSARSSEQSQPPHAAPPPSRACTVIGVPMTYGQPYVGTDTSPHQLRQSGLISKLQQLSWQVKDSGNLPFDAYISDALKAPETLSKRQEALQTFHGNAKNMFEVGIGTHQLAQLVASTLQDATTPQFPLILGGDHSIAIGSLAGLLQVHPDLGVLWIDAHADINTPYITESGNMHGMPIGFLMDPIMERTFQQFRVNQKMITADASSWTVPGFEWLQHEFKNRLKPNQLVYVGLRDVDIEERKLITSLGIQAYTMTDIDRHGIGNVIEMALQHLKDRPLHCSYDIDAVDPILAPATGTAVRGGLSFREAHYVAEAVAASGRLVSAEIVELNPMLSNETGASDTIDLGLQIVLSLMGKSIL